MLSANRYAKLFALDDAIYEIPTAKVAVLACCVALIALGVLF